MIKIIIPKTLNFHATLLNYSLLQKYPAVSSLRSYFLLKNMILNIQCIRVDSEAITIEKNRKITEKYKGTK